LRRDTVEGRWNQSSFVKVRAFMTSNATGAAARAPVKAGLPLASALPNQTATV
jgi:hypothetical protein